MSTEPTTYCTTAQVARLVGVRPQTVRCWRLRGTGPRYHRLGPYPTGRVIYALRDVETWLAARAHRSTSEESAASHAAPSTTTTPPVVPATPADERTEP